MVQSSVAEILFPRHVRLPCQYPVVSLSSELFLHQEDVEEMIQAEPTVPLLTHSC